MPVLIVAALGSGVGTAAAQPQLPPLPPLPELPTLPPMPPLPTLELPVPAQVDLPQLPAPQLPALPQLPGLPQVPAPPQLPSAAEASGMVADRAWPDNQPKREAFQTMTNEIGIGWANGGQQRMMAGSVVGLLIGCVSIFPNFMAGCMIGNVVGAGIGAVMGIDEGNPKARPSVEKFLATP
ncbi:hypothetical protein [Rhodococcus spelaei]|uniref:hypothetical protein n=1 Tax=Rhodococcus spelaei TaxID=2546320 RepID=UPI0015EFA78A|nr:hypothetical protein [Rhodococcus spelaei]